MNISFNLIDERWIPCLRADGTRDELSLRDTLAQAHQLREICGDTPLETAALHRLLLAVLHRVFGPKGRTEWTALWKRHTIGFEVSLLESYFVKWRHKFNLLDANAPFFQVVDESQLGEIDTINKMMTRLTSDATLFEHTLNDAERGAVLTIAQAARALVSLQCYGLGYKQFVDAPCAKAIVFLIQGDTLFETLVLNMIPYPQAEGDYYSTSNDMPAWEHDNPFLPVVDGKPVSRDARVITKDGKEALQYANHTPLGYLDYLTWQNRKIKLLCLDGKTVREIAWSPGMRLTDDVLDPMQSYSESESGWRALAFSPDRALWRDSDALLKAAEGSKKVKPLAAVAWLSRLARQNAELLPKAYRLAAFGLSKNRAKLEFIRSETTPLPLDYLQRDDLLPHVSTALELAEKTGKLLNRCAFLLAWLIRTPSTPDVKFDESNKSFDEQKLIDDKFAKGKNDKSKDREAQQVYQLFVSFGVERLYWSQLEVHFYRLIQDLPGDPEAAKDKWRGHLKRVARAAFNRAIAYAGTDYRAQRAIVKADEQFQSGLARLLEIKQPNSTNGGETNDTH